MTNERRKLTDILCAGDRDRLTNAWEQARAAEDFGPLPKGEYIARFTEGGLSTAKTGTPSYKLTFQVVEGEHAGQRFWHDIYLTEAAMPMAKCDLGKLGVTDLAQLDHPFPEGFKCKVQVSLRRGDDGSERNKVNRFEVIAFEPPEPDAFAPADVPQGKSPADASNPASANGEAKELFPFGANASADGPDEEGR
jgi:hypothetical protein